MARQLFAGVHATLTSSQYGTLSCHDHPKFPRVILGKLLRVNITVGTAKQILAVYRARQHDVYLGAWGPDYPDPNTNAATFAVNQDNRDEAGLTGQLAWRNSWDIPQMSKDTLAAVVENDRDMRARMYNAIQRQHQEVSPFAVMFQKIEQTGRSEKVKNLNLGGAITAVSYWVVTK